MTVCLDPASYQRPGVLAAYQQVGFEVIDSAGPEPVDYDRVTGNPLPRLLAEFRRHQRVASDRLSTPVLYGIAAGCAPAVYGGDTPAEWPELSGPDPDPALAGEITDQELGRAWKMPPAELRRLFDWRERV